MRYSINLLIISMFLSFFLLCSSAMGQNQEKTGSKEYLSPNINHNLLSKITLWNSLKIAPDLRKQDLTKQTPRFSEQNRHLLDSGPSTQLAEQQSSTQKLPLGIFFGPKNISQVSSGNTTSSAKGVRVSPYLLFSKIHNNSQLSSFWQEKLNAAPQETTSENVYWLGGNLSYSTFDPLNLQVNSLYGTNSLQNKHYYSSWVTDVGVEYDMEKLTPVFHLFYSSENKENYFPTKRNQLSFGLEQPNMFGQKRSSSTPGTNSITTTDKNLGIQVGAQDLNLFNRLNNSFNLFYAKNIYSEQLEDKHNASKLDYSEEIPQNMVNSMWGVDLSSYYNLYENLSVGLYFSYTSTYPKNQEESDNIDNSRIHSDLNFEF